MSKPFLLSQIARFGAQRAVWLGLSLCIASAETARGQWTFHDLHPAVATESHALGVGDGQEVGYVIINTRKVASLWSGTPASWIGLEPAGATESVAYRTRGGVQVGYAIIGGRRIAGMWSGTAASWAPLEPAGATESVAYGVEGGHQVGYAIVNGVQQASLWSGTAQSWVSLHPVGSTYSIAYGVEGNTQVGTASSSPCAVWNGTAASLTPLPSCTSGRLVAVSQGQCAGTRWVFDYHPHLGAGVWSVTPPVLTNLIPWGPDFDSEALDVYHGYQVGYSDEDLGRIALVWNGSTAYEAISVVNGPWGVGQMARGVWSDQTTLYVVGGRLNRAVMWKRPLCKPDIDYTGTLTANDIFAFVGLWFAGDPAANFDLYRGIQVQDIFAFLNAWFTGC